MDESSLEHMSTFGLVVWGMVGIVHGTSLGGLVLFVSRRYRGVTFPVYPGETLLFVMGANLAALGPAALFLWLVAGSGRRPSWQGFPVAALMAVVAQV